MKPFLCTTFVIPPVKGFHLVRDMPECIKEFSKKSFSRDIPACRALFKYNFILQDTENMSLKPYF